MTTAATSATTAAEASAMKGSSLSRRKFLKHAAAGSGGLLLGFTFHPFAMAFPPSGDSGATGADNKGGGAAAWRVDALLEITPDNRFIFTSPRDEMGQGATTGLATLIAEELDLDPARLDIRFPGADKAFVNPLIGFQITGGSTSINAHYLPLRQAGASTRRLLLQAAARDLNVAIENLATDNGHILAGSARHPYGRFAATARRLELPADDAAALKPPALKEPSEFKHIGRHFPRLDALAKSDGSAAFGIDVELPGMHRAVVLRPPVAGGELKACDPAPALAMPGVSAVAEISTGVAVVAEQFWQAKQAAQRLAPEWDLPELAAVDSAGLRADYAAALAEGKGVDAAEQGDLPAGFAAAATVLESEYWTPFLAHAPLEPMNAAARVANGEADIWTGTQTPQAVQGLAARALGIKREKVRVHSAYMGGGFGRRGTADYAVEAAEIAAASGRAVQLLWTREDDMRHGAYRPASLMRIRAGVAADGAITAWQAARVGGNITPGIMKTTLPGIAPEFLPGGLVRLAAKAADAAFARWTVDGTSVEGLADDYDFPNRAVSHITLEHGLPLTFWRSVGHSYTAFAKECMMDELARAAGMDPAAFRLRNARGNPRLAGVIRLAAERMNGLGLGAAPGRGVGMAAHSSFGSYVAQAAEVSVKDGRIRVHRVACAVDCGIAVNPDIIRAQMEGAIMFGLTAALHGEIELEGGKVRQGNFHDYPLLRMSEAPAVEVIIAESTEPPSGVGEPGLPPIAPAVANAVHSLTGQRLRALPLRVG